MVEEKTNATQFPRLFYARHMQPGICGYEKETILIDTDTVKRMMPTFIGKPVYINHQKVDLANLKEQAAGYIVESFYNELDGWAWVKFLAVDDACYHAVGNSWSVSNAYIPTDWGGAGTKNNCPYRREILVADFTHLAIVSNPRYEGACIMSPDEFKIYQETKKTELEELTNSKSNLEGKTMLNLFKNKREEVTKIDAETMVELENGKSVSLQEMINAVTEEKKNAKKEEKMNGDSVVECDGEKMPLKELVSKYNAMMEKKNETVKDVEDDENKKEEKKASKNKSKKNSDDEDDEDADDGKGDKEKPEDEEGHEDEHKAGKKEKKNSHFDELRNAHLNGKEVETQVETSMDKLERGRQYFSLDSK